MRGLIFFIPVIFSGILTYSQSCLPEGIDFVRQGQVDSFPQINPGCMIIEGNVYIGGLWEQPCTIDNLDSLISIISINGDLTISGEYGYPLESLLGLSNLQSVGGNLTLTPGNLITDLEGFNSLHTIGGNALINHNFLTTLEGLANLDSIGGDLQLGTTSWLADLNGLNSLSFIGGNLSIDYNGSLTDISALASLTFLNGNLEIYNNDFLSTLSGLHNIDTIMGDVVIDYNSLLPDCNGLDNLSFIGGWFQVNANEGLEDLQGLNSLEHTGGGLVLFDNPLMSLSGLEAMVSIGDRLQIEYCGWLSNLDALQNLKSIGGMLNIQNNGSLLNLDGLGNINAGSISELNISHNLSLSSCDAKSICAYLANPGGSVTIVDNAAGCNSPEEVMTECSYGQPDIRPAGQPDIRVYPNPAGGIVDFRLSIFDCRSGRVMLKIFDVQGREMVTLLDEKKLPGEYSLEFDVSILEPGIYFYRLTADGQTAGGKLVVVK